MGNFFSDLFHNPVSALGGGLAGTLIKGPIGGLAGMAVGALLNKKDKKKEPQTGGNQINLETEEESGGGGESSGVANEDIFAQYLKYNPQYAAQMWRLAQQYQPLYAALSRDLMSQERGADLADVERLAPQVQSIRAGYERPEMAAIRNELFKQIQGELAMGTRLTPDQNASVLESIRSAQVARGGSMGAGASNRESVLRALEGMNLQTQRQEKAKSLVSMEAAQQPDPFSIILNRPGTSVSMGAAQAGQNQTLPGFYAQNYWNTQNQGMQQQQINNEMARYNLGLSIAAANPYLEGFRI